MSDLGSLTHQMISCVYILLQISVAVQWRNVATIINGIIFPVSTSYSNVKVSLHILVAMQLRSEHKLTENHTTIPSQSEESRKLTSVSGACTNVYFFRISMRAILASMRANLIPMQLRGPQPKGMWQRAGRFAFSSGVNLGKEREEQMEGGSERKKEREQYLSGSNFSGSGQNSGL